MKSARGYGWMVGLWGTAIFAFGCAQAPKPASENTLTAPVTSVVVAKEGPTQKEKLRSMGFVETPEGFALTLAGLLLFATNSDQLASEAQQSLTRLGRELVALEISRIKVHGHTDNTGTEAINADLSLRRATAVMRVLVSSGMDTAKVEREGFAARFPVASNDSESGRSQNRRVVILIPN